MKQPHVRWGFIVAIILGVLLALWLLSGDTTPDAAGARLRLNVVIEQYQSNTDVDFFSISPDSGDGGGTAIVSMDHQFSLAKFLREHPGGHVLLLEAK